MRLPSGNVPALSVPLRAREISPRALNGPDSSESSKAAIIIAIIISIVVAAVLILYLVARQLRSTHPEGKFLPGSWMKQRWRAWKPSTVRKQYSATLAARRSVQFDSMTPAAAALPDSNVVVDRHTSVRSVMTLPAYSEGPRPTEKLIGREGERGGIDTVVEFPETAEEEEAHREEEMESLYQIRAARRQAHAEREERRRLRRGARESGNIAALRELSRPLSTPAPAALVAQHESRDRGRRISAVTYAALGTAHHDGSRVRASSNDSDRPLLDNAVGPEGAPRLRSDNTSSGNTLRFHFRNLSTPSLRLNLGPDYSDDEGTNSQGRRRGISDLTQRLSSQSSTQLLQAANFPEGESLPQQEPPRYGEGWEEEDDLGPRRSTQIVGEAPPYESPTRTGAPRLPAMAPLPAIEITPFSPIFGDEGDSSIWGRNR